MDAPEKTNKDTARILIVDDQIHTLHGMARIMRSAGYQVLEASNGSECLKLAAKEKPDLILLDVVLPDIDGLEVCRRIKSSPDTADIYVVLLSSVNIESDSQAAGLELGADGYIARPVANRELLARVKAMLRLRYAENHLRENEELFRAMFEHHNAVMLLIEPVGGNIVDANHAAKQFYGYTTSQLCSMSIGQINILPQEEFEAVRSLALKGQRNHFIVPHRLANGEIRTVEVYSSPITQNRKTVLFSIIHDITEQERNRKALQESEQLFRGIFELSPVGKSLTAPGGQLLMVNRAFADMLGYSVEELRQMNFADITAPEDLPASRECVRCLLAGERNVYRMEKRYLSKNGTLIWTDLTTFLFRDPKGIPLYFLSTILDITYHKQAEAALKEGEFRFNRAEFLSGLGHWEIDLSTKRVKASNGARNIYGVDQQELTLYEIQSIPLPEHRSLLDTKLNALVRDGEPYDIEFQIRRVDDNRVVDIHSVAHYDPEKNVVFGTIHDITDLRQAEERHRLLFAAIEQAAEGIVITDATGVIQYVNPAEQTISGYGSDELIGQRATIFKSGKQDDNFYRKLWKTINSGKVWSGRFINKKKGGTEYYEDATISPVHNKFGKLTNFVAVKRDVTKQLELQGQLFQAQKLEAIGNLAAGVAHDFNNLLQVVSGYSDLILLAKKPGDTEYADLQTIREAGKRGTDLVTSLLTFSRKVKTQYVPVNLNQEIISVTNLLYRTIPKTIEIDLNLNENLESIQGDSSQIGQVLMNLGVNARDAMPDGGALTVQTENVELDDEYCRVHHETIPGRYVLLTVSDTGEGMDKETVSHIFEPFFTTKPRGKGTGLGLATVYGIVKQHGGQITCYSERGIGTTFKIYFPIIMNEKDTGTSTIETPIRGGTETILLVDDERSVRDLGTRLLERFGYKVVTAPDGKHALEIYRSDGESISLIILDFVMPMMDGKQCLMEILRIDPDAKIVMTSGYSESRSAEKFVAAGAKGFIPKPFDMRQLLDKVREVLDQV